MESFTIIQQKLASFIKKYYANELIKGCILFISLGLLYLLFTLLVEYLFWFTPTYRTILFWLFLCVEVFLLVKFIAFPIFKIIGLKKGITTLEASNIIGKHFPEVNDKLVNVIQLKNHSKQSELLQAGITQKSEELQPIPFKRAINFSKNIKYLKYAVLPFFVWFLVYVTGNIKVLSSSLKRVVNHSTYYQPPAPFVFKLITSNLSILEGKSLVLQIQTVGSIIPADVKIVYNNKSFYLKNKGDGVFEHEISNVENDISFYLEANNVVSEPYSIQVIRTPLVRKIDMQLIYPSYTGKKAEIIANSGNAIVPQGTKVNWMINTYQTEVVTWTSATENITFKKKANNKFSLSKIIKKSINYKIASSNKALKEYENLAFFIETIADTYPQINVKSNIDSVSVPPVQFVGQLSDDYMVTKLQLVYFDENKPNIKQKHNIKITKGNVTNFYYVFPEELQLKQGVNYRMYFEVFDNDAVNGSKKTKSREFSFYNKTENELEQQQLQKQKYTINQVAKTAEQAKKRAKQLEELKNNFQKKKELNWNDTKQLEEFVNRQKQYQKIFNEQLKNLSEDLSENPKTEKLKQQQAELKKRLEEIKQLTKENTLEKELKELSKKIQKEDLLKKLNKLSEKNKQKQLSLERMLELTRNFYVEKKAEQLQEKLKNLADRQEETKTKNNTIEAQKKINDAFNKLQKDTEDLEKENQKLKKPIGLPEMKPEMLNINYDLEKAVNNLQQSKLQKAKQSQQSAANKMKELANKMKSNIEAMEAEEIEENIEDLRKIVENLIEFSFQQEDLLEAFSSIDISNAKYPNHLKKQQVLKEYFEHIDDSLYVLSLRVPKISSFIQKEVSEVHYNLDKSIVEFSEGSVSLGISTQQYTITGANNLASELSNVLDAMMNAQMSFKNGKGKKSFTLPDIMQKQGELLQKMRNALKRKEKGNKRERVTEVENEAIYEMYKQQAKLREMLQELLSKSGKKQGNKATMQMEEIEKILLKNGFTNAIEKKMKKLNYELLKLKNAKKEQGEDKKREAAENTKKYNYKVKKKLEYQKLFKNNTEILNRQSLPLQTIYKKKVQQYFKLNPNDSI